MIHRPVLPPKNGYVEVIDENGNHIYKPTPETQEKQRESEYKAAIQQDMDAMIVDYEYRLTLLELGV